MKTVDINAYFYNTSNCLDYSQDLVRVPHYD